MKIVVNSAEIRGPRNGIIRSASRKKGIFAILEDFARCKGTNGELVLRSPTNEEIHVSPAEIGLKMEVIVAT